MEDIKLLMKRVCVLFGVFYLSVHWCFFRVLKKSNSNIESQVVKTQQERLDYDGDSDRDWIQIETYRTLFSLENSIP